MSFKLDLGPTHHLLLGGPGAKGVEGWHLVDPILVVKSLNPLVNAGYLIPPVDITRRGWLLSGNQTSFGAGRSGAMAKELFFHGWNLLLWLVGVVVDFVYPLSQQQQQ